MKHNFLPQAYHRGGIMPFDQANVSIATHALHYGTAAFGGLRARPDRHQAGQMVLFRADLHAKRLSDSARLLGHKLTPQQILKAISQFIAANPGDQPYYIRPLAYTSDTGIVPRLHDIQSDLLIYGIAQMQHHNHGDVTAGFSSWTRGEDRSQPLRGKISGTYVTSALSCSEAANRGFDEAILLNSRGKVSEGSAMNIFMVKNGTLVTPSVTQDILEGITRRSLLELAADLNIAVEEREIDKSELLLADEVFFSGTAVQVVPVSRIEQYELPASRPVTDRLAKSLGDIVNQASKNHADWLTSYPAASR